jgi:hypothetical protein
MSEQKVYEGRWGFYPCDYETYRKIKLLHKWYWEAIRDWANWCRWERKEPQNRVIKRKVKDSKGNTVGREVVGPKPEPVVCPHFLRNGKPSPWYGVESHGLGTYYAMARYPKKTAEEVKHFGSHELKRLMDLYDKVVSWREEQKKAA